MIDACCYADSDGETAAVHVATVRRARKRHVCDECPAAIEPGERYEHVRGLWDGFWDTNRTCLPCQRMRDGTLCSWTYGRVWDDIRDCLGEDVL